MATKSPATKKEPKLTREQAVALVKQQEPGINLGAGSSDAGCSTAELCFLAELAPRLRVTRPENFPGSTGRFVYEFLARHKFWIWELFANYTGEWEAESEGVYLTRREAHGEISTYRKNAPEHSYKLRKRKVTQYQYDNL